MNCNNCNGNTGLLKRPVIKHTMGNYLTLMIPLSFKWHVVTDGVEQVTEQGQIDRTMNIHVVLVRGKKEYRFVPEISNNQVVINEQGKLPLGTYDIVIEIDDDGNHFRYKQRTLLQVVDTTDEGQQYDNDEINVIAVYPVVEGAITAISFDNGRANISENGTFQGDDKPNNGRADITAKQGEGHLVFEDGKAKLFT